MRHAPFALVLALAVPGCMTACSAPGETRLRLRQLLAEAPNDSPPRILLDGDRIDAVAVPLGPGSLPPAVRTTFDAIAPGGTTRFVGRESSRRGDGYRVEKAYEASGTASARSVLCTASGEVLERWHTVPIADVPQTAATAALRVAPVIDEARIVSGPTSEELWSFTLHDRIGWTFVVEVALDGRLLRRTRQLAARVES